MAFCTFLVKCVGKRSLLFTAKLCFPDPSDSPLAAPPSSGSLSEAHSSPMSGRGKSSVLGAGPGGIRARGSNSPGQGWRGRGLAAAPPPPAGPPMDGSAAHVLGLPGSDRGAPAATTARPATEPPGQGAEGGGRRGPGAPLRAGGESGASAGRRVGAVAARGEVPAGPAGPAPPERAEAAAAGEGPAGDAVEVLKILAKRAPRSGTAPFMLQPGKCRPGRLPTAASRAAGLHAPPAGTRTGRPGRGLGSAGLWRLHAQAPRRAGLPDAPGLRAARPRGPADQRPRRCRAAAGGGWGPGLRPWEPPRQPPGARGRC